MLVEKRWQDRALIAVGLLLAASPLLFAPTMTGPAAWAAYILGGFVIVFGAAAMGFDRMVAPAEVAQVVLAAVLFFSPSLFGYAAVTGMVWMDGLVALAIVLIVATEFVTATPRQARAAR